VAMRCFVRAGVALALMLAAVNGCSSGRPGASASPGARTRTSVAIFTDGEWTFGVDSSATYGLWGLLEDEGAPVQYQPVADGVVYAVTLSDRGTRVSITGAHGPFVGARSTVSEHRIIFKLTEWAGGRFVVRPGDPNLRAELTLFGSGVPVTSSDRGRLISSP
jgi:hypothetical protein